MDKESDAFLLPKFAYAYKHYCLPSWLRDRRSQRRIGIVNGGMQTSTWDTWKREAQTSIARQEKARGLPQFVGVIGVSRCCARHQSPRLNVGNVAVEYALADVVDGAELTTGDVVVYDLAWAEDPDRKLKSIRYAKNIVLIKGSEEYTGDPMVIDTFATMFDPNIETKRMPDGRLSVNKSEAHYIGENYRIDF